MQAITQQFSSFSFPHLCDSALSKIRPQEILEKISRVANHVFIHLGTALAINLAFDFAFGVLALPFSVHVLTIACATSLVIVIAIKIGKLAYAHFNQKALNPLPSPLEQFTSWSDSIAKGLAHLSIVNTLLLKPSILIHECGHALAAMTCFVKASPTVVVKWATGLTEYNISYGLTRFGGFLGEEAAKLFVTAAGLFTPALFALGEFGLAHGLHESYPWVSDVLNYHGLSQLLNLGLYGISAFFSSQMALAHDFIYLWVIGGLHPAIPIAILVAIPLCAFITFKVLEYRKEICKQNTLHQQAIPV